ncbi:MAG: thioredoxin domain-containing protein [Acidobacteriota bacterium]
MKKPLLLAAVCLLSTAVFAADEKPAPPLGPKAEAMIEQLLPVCSEAATPTRTGLVHSLPLSMTGNVIQIESKRSWCGGQWVAITTKEGGFFFGVPWFLDGMAGTIEEKLRAFTWKNMQQSYSVTVDRTKTRDGLYRVSLVQTTEQGKVPMEGEVDPAGSVFFLGHFLPMTGDARSARIKALAPMVAKSPTTGSATPQVTVVEFSDFECPSCQHSASYLKPILAAHGDKVRYVRFDMPLLAMHPWAFSAAVAGRAVYRQKPELFWTYKEHVYENQEKLNTFTIDDFVRGFAQDHDLDLTKFDADVASPAVKAEILDGVAAAFTNDVRSTPTYLVNGVTVDPGKDGKALANYVEKALK